MPAERDLAVPVTPLLHAGSARPTFPLEEQRMIDAATTATTTKSRDTRQYGSAKTATFSYVTMDVMMTASESTTSNMVHLVKIEHHTCHFLQLAKWSLSHSHSLSLSLSPPPVIYHAHALGYQCTLTCIIMYMNC